MRFIRFRITWMESSYLYLNGLRFHYFRRNAEGGSRPLVFHHGLASNARIWEMVTPRLGERGYPTYALDARGHGLSDKPENGYDIETITGDLAAFIQTCQLDHPVLVGHSWGANIALNYAARYAIGPYAPGGIVLVDGGISQLDDIGVSWEQMEQRLSPPRLAGMPLAQFLPQLMAWFSEWGGSEQAVSIAMDNFDIDMDERIYPRLTFERHMRIVRSIWDFKTYAYFSRVRCPVVMVPARPKEPISTPDAEFLKAKQGGIDHAEQTIRNLRVEWLPDTIHDIPLQRPGELANLIFNFAGSLIDHDR
jgi:pimeloyl-ACP methyl ester carboxylesterase